MMRPFPKFLTIFFSLLSIFAIVPFIADGGLEDFRFRPIYYTTGFLAIISAGHAFVFDRFGSGFWKSLGLAACAVFIGIFSFSFLSSAIIYNEVRYWIPISQGLATVIFLLGTVTLWTLFSGTNNLRIHHEPREMLKISGLTAVVAFLATSVMSSDQYLLHGKSWDSFASILRILAVFSVANAGVAGLLIFWLLRSSFWQRRIYLVALIVPLLMVGMNIVAFNRYFGNNYVKTIGLYAVCLPITLFILALLAYRTKSQKLNRLSFEFAQRDAQYLNLKQQIEPHFLFNNLNTLLSFVETQPARALAFGQNLSEVYRHFLQCHDQEFVPIGPELKFLQDYLEIYRVKHGSAFDFKIQSCDTAEVFILSMSVRELADNFFKHNILSDQDPPLLEVWCTQAHLVFRNTRRPKPVLSGKTGLENMTKRYRLLTGLEISIEEDEFFTVRLPLLYL